MAKVVIDAGHGGNTNHRDSSWNNAVGPGGSLEKDFTLSVAIKAKESIESLGIEALLTRAADTNLGLAERAAVAKTSQAQAFVSIHFNSPGSTEPPAQGTETWVHPSLTAGSDRLASCIQNRILEATRHRDRGVRKRAFGVLKPQYHDPQTAAALVEISFLERQPDEEARLSDPEYVHAIANGLAVALSDFLQSPNNWGTKRYTPQEVKSFALESIDHNYYHDNDVDA